MFSIMDNVALTARHELRRSMLHARTQQFLHRHGWELSTDHEGLEVDQFDREGTIYCVLHEGERHVSSVRLRHSAEGCMVKDYFQPFWQRHESRLSLHHEVTRLCCAPRTTNTLGEWNTSELLIGLHEYCREAEISEFYGIIFPSVARVLSRIGWPPLVLDEMDLRGERLLLGVWNTSEQALVRLLASARKTVTSLPMAA